MSCENIPSLLDLQKVKKHADDFGRLMGTSEGDSTNEVTGQVRPTYNKVMKSVGFKPGSGDFTTGFTVMPGERDIAWYDPVSKNWYSYLGVIPSPSGHPVSSVTSPVGNVDWAPRTDQAEYVLLRNELANPGGSDIVGFHQAGAGSVARTSQDKMRETLSPADKGAVAGGVIDATLAFQRALDEAVADTITVDLCGRSYAITTVNIPNAKAVAIKNGRLLVKGAGSLGLSKRTTVSPQGGGEFARYDLVCDNIQFERSESGGACVDIKLAWQDSTAGIVLTPSCNFELKNGAVGVRLSRSFGNSISGRYNMDATSTAILCDASEVVAADAYPSGPMETIVDTAFFEGGIAFDQVFVNGSNWNSFEGFSFGPGCRFYGSKFFAKKYNSLKINGVHGVSWNAVLDSGINTSITGGYYDRQTANDWLFKFLTTIKGSQGITIGGGATLSAQGSIGDMVVFSDADSAPGAQITNVVIGTSYWVGGINSGSQAIRGLLFKHNGLRNVLVDGSQSFQMMYACMTFVRPISRSLIKAFDARDISLYSENTAYGFGDPLTHFNRFDGIYRVYTVEMWVPTYLATAVSEVIHKQTITFDNMMRHPIATVSNITAPFGAGNFTLTAPVTYRNSVEIDLIKNVSAPGNGRGGCGATLTLDASQHIAPL